MAEPIKFSVKIVADPELSQSKAEELVFQLRRELKDLDVLRVDSLQSNELLPEGAKVLEPISALGMLVTVGNETKQLTSMVRGIQDWVTFTGTCRVVMADEYGNKIELDKATRDERQMLINAWISAINIKRPAT